MLFNTWAFAVFLLVVFVVYHSGVTGRWSRTAFGQVSLLTVGNFLFYGYRTPWFTALLAFSILFNSLAARRLVENSATGRSNHRAVTLAVAGNLAILSFFKYGPLLVGSLLPEPWASQARNALAAIPLPVGISFYTFQGISVAVDLYRADAAGVPGLERPAPGPRGSAWFFEKIWFFISFFPHSVAGPIVKAHEFVDQIGFKRLADVDWNDAARKLSVGFFLKMVVADNLKEATSQLAYPAFLTLPRVNLLALLYGYSFQIFADFCGYSLIAMGLARLFGYRLPINFNYPYLSKSITEFWTRWHISLSTWLREYLYIPLGGNRRGPARTYLNLFVVMFLGGLWHGAAWSYAIWGTAHGTLLAIERALLGTRAQRARPNDSLEAMDVATGASLSQWIVVGARVLLTFNLVSLLWLLFKLPDFRHAVLYLKLLVSSSGQSLQPQSLFLIALFSLPVVLYHLAAACAPTLRATLGKHGYERSINMSCGVLVFLTLVNSGTSGDFIYFQF